MRIVLLTFDLGEYSVHLASALAPYGEVHLLIPEVSLRPFGLMINGTFTVHTFAKPRLRQPLKQLAAVSTLARQIRELRPDVIHVQQGHLWFNLALPFLSRFPLVVTSHDPLNHSSGEKTPQWIFDLAFRSANQIIVHVPQMKTLLSGRLNILDDRIHIIPHPFFEHDPENDDVPEDESLVLFFGRISEYKGLKYLIHAEPLISERVPTARFVIAGTGDNLDTYRRMMTHPDKFTIYDEYLSNESRTQLFRKASVVVLPYTDATQSGVIPVAYSFAKPVIATAVGGLPAQVDDGSTGILVPPRNAHALADAIVRLLRDPDLRRRYGANGRRRVIAEAKPEAVATATLAVYERCIEESSHPRVRSLPSRSNVDKTNVHVH